MLRQSVFRSALLAVLFVLCSVPCRAQPFTFEQLFGATNINGAVGNGRLIAAFSEKGELTVLRWPNPSFYEHLAYLSSNVADARQLPYFGALPTMGAFFGLLIEQNGRRTVTWLRDAPWTSAQTYLDYRSNVLVTTYTNADWGLEAKTFAFVSPDFDALVWRLEVTQQPDSPVTVVRGIFYENLSPSVGKTPYAPVDGWALDFLNDFAAIYDQSTEAVVHLRPKRTFYPVLTPLLSKWRVTEADAWDFLNTEVAHWREGAYLGVTVLDKDFTYQVGVDNARNCKMLEEILAHAPWEVFGLPDWIGNTPVCLADPLPTYPLLLGWKHLPWNAFTEANSGELTGSPAAGIQANAAFAFPLSMGWGRHDEATVVIAAADRLDALRALLGKVKPIPYAEHLTAVQGYWHRWTNGAIVPDTADLNVKSFAVRLLISLKTAQDWQNGSIVASISTQPPYSLDWPRDSSFKGYTLDLAGYHEEVTRLNLTYQSWQRQQPLPFGLAPAGTYEMNYYNNGMPGGPLLFEIDNTGLITWEMWNHYVALSSAGDPGAADYLAAIYPAIYLAADNLAACKDETNGLQCLATEDDNWVGRTQTMIGASTVYGALIAAVAAGEQLGDDPARVQAWRDRAAELKAAAIAIFWDENEGHFNSSFKGECYSIFPGGMLDPDDPMAAAEAAYLRGDIEHWMLGQDEIQTYTGNAFLALAWYYRQTADSAGLTWMQQMVSQYLAWIPTKGTQHLGEVVLLYDEDGDGFRETAVNEVAMPFLWEAANFFDAAVLAYGGAPLPPLEDDDSVDDDNVDDDNVDDDVTDDDADDDATDDDTAPPADHGDDDAGCGC